ncbi:hypothetical protein ABT160_44415 [Streptomyces sp. NPDC001941]|uniref:hypothetical protein n=1 Tax=Streptomyces sp. NPDC001941 TaxID=3154659 RepID=UPI0033189298
MAAGEVPGVRLVGVVTDWVLLQCALLRATAPGADVQERRRAASGRALADGMEETARTASRELLVELGREQVSRVLVAALWKVLIRVVMAAGDWRRAPDEVRGAVEGVLAARTWSRAPLALSS